MIVNMVFLQSAVERLLVLVFRTCFMALLTVSIELALTEAVNSVLTAGVFHGLAANFGFCACVLYIGTLRLQG